MRVLLVEDHDVLSREIIERLKGAGFFTDRAASISDAQSSLKQCAYSLALIDRRLADGDGLSLISEIRAKQGNAAIMMLTALDAVDDRIQGLDTGADDYLTKPFSLDEMMARIRALLRRRFAGGSNTLAVGDLTLDTTSRACCVAGRPIVFSRRELQLLETLMRSANCVVSRESLIKDLYGDEALIQEHALTALVSRVRARLSGLKAHAYIHVAHGVGYLITDVEKKA